jgi:diguanylate cyclase (GGDEF)-like protein
MIRPGYSEVAMEPRAIRVLVVEDNPADAQLVQNALSGSPQASYGVSRVERLSQALDFLECAPVDVVLLDLSLADSRGLQTYAALQQHNPDLPVVVLNDDDDERAAQQAVNSGAQDSLRKDRIDGELLCRSIRYAIERQRLLREMRALALHDELTGLFNRRGLTVAGETLVQVARREHCGIAAVYLDLDDLKRVNDTFGHDAGDRALWRFAQCMKESFRDSDVLGRIGGDEFCALMMVHGAAGVAPALERLRTTIDLEDSGGPESGRLAFSAGLATTLDLSGEPLQELMQQADGAMYSRKRVRNAA